MPSSPFADLTATQYEILLIIADADRPTQGEVIREYQTRRATTSRPQDAIRQLDQRGYVNHGDDPDEHAYRLTDKGNNALWLLRDELQAAIEAAET